MPRVTRPKTVRIPREWYPLLPGQNLVFWVRVDALRRRRGVRKKDMAGVRQCADAVFFGEATDYERKDKRYG